MSNWFFILMLAVFLTAGCRRESADAARSIHYDNEKTSLLVEICECISRNEDEKLPALLQTLEEHYPFEKNFVEEIRITLQRRQDAREMAQLLRNGDYEELRDYMEKSIGSGYGEADSFQYDSLPDALLSLARFRSKMPWEDATVLEQEFLQLELYCAPLESSPAFQAFREEQLATLQVLREKRAREHAERFRKRIQNALLVGERNALSTAERAFAREQPDHDFFAYLAILQQQKAPSAGVSEEMQPFLAAAALQEWENLPAEVRKQISALIANDNSLAKQYIEASLSRDFLSFLRAVEEEGIPVGGRVFKDVLADEVVPRAEAFGKSPVPGPIEVFSILTNIK